MCLWIMRRSDWLRLSKARCKCPRLLGGPCTLSCCLSLFSTHFSIRSQPNKRQHASACEIKQRSALSYRACLAVARGRHTHHGRASMPATSRTGRKIARRACDLCRDRRVQVSHHHTISIASKRERVCGHPLSIWAIHVFPLLFLSVCAHFSVF